MYLMYVDESGDTGLERSPTTHFALSSIVIHESRWRDFINAIVDFRRRLRLQFGLPIRTEIHAAEHLRHPPYPGISRFDRLRILVWFIDEIARLDYISITNVIVEKTTKTPDYDVFNSAWRTLFQRFENTLYFGNFPGASRSDFGIVFTDNTDGKRLTRLVRKMAVYNPIPNAASYGPGYRDIPITRIVDDPNLRDSRDSYPIQACDTVSYFLMQKFRPNAYIRRMGAQAVFDRLAPVLNKRARPSDPLGIVRL
jgi:hypothetical protein